MKNNVEVIHFYIKSTVVAGLVFVQKAFEKYATNFCFGNGKVGIETAFANL